MEANKKRSNQEYYKLLIVYITMIVLFAFSVSAVSFSNSVIKEGVTEFEWCFDNPFETQKTLKTTEFELYQDNFGCDIQDSQIFAEYDVYQDYQYCYNDDSCDNHKLNTSCKPNQICETRQKKQKTRNNLKQTDFMLPTDARICLTAKRQAKTNLQKCDINFKYNDGITQFDVADYGFAWWNSTFQNKIQMNFTNRSFLSQTQFLPVKVVLNTTNFEYDRVQSDCGDVRFLNSAEDTELDYTLSYCNTSGSSIFYVNVSMTNDTLSTIYMYFNSTSVVSTTSDFPSTFGRSVTAFYDFSIDDRDVGGVHGGTANGAAALFIRNESDEWERKVGHYNFSDSSWLSVNNSVINWGSAVQTIITWFRLTDLSERHDLLGSINGGGAGYQIFFLNPDKIRNAKQGVANIELTWSADNNWHQVAILNDGSGMKTCLDGCTTTQTGGNTGAMIDSTFPVAIGGRQTGASTADEYFPGQLDEVLFFDSRVDEDLVEFLYNWPEPTLRTVEVQAGATTTDVLLLNGDDNTILPTFNVLELQEFYVAANYSFNANSTAVENGFCNFTADNILDLNVMLSSGTNTTVCGVSGCDSTNYTFEFTGLDTDNINHDLIIVPLCHTQNDVDAQIDLSCGASYTIPVAQITECSSGFNNITIIDNNCTGAVSTVNVSVTSSGNGLPNSITLVDTAADFFRNHNHSEQIEFNSTNNLYQDDDTHAYFLQGTQDISMNCFDNVTGSLNTTDNQTITIVNVAPIVTIDEIMWWLLASPISFLNATAAKYPLISTLNITSQILDENIDHVITYLNFSNGTNIDTNTQTGQQSSFIQYLSSNFSTDRAYLNGSQNYIYQIWANDTNSNITTDQVTFTVENDIPTFSWVNSSPLTITSVPSTLNFTCSDDENEVGTTYLFINNTNASDPNVTTTDPGYIFNLSQNTWNITGWCNDSFINSSAATILATYTQLPTPTFTQPAEGVKYLVDNATLTWQFSVLNAPTNCTYRINDYQNVTVNNCTSGANNIQFIDGFNEWVVCMHLPDVTECNTVRFWVQKANRDTGDYLPIIIWIIIGLLIFGAAEMIRIPILQMVTAIYVMVFAVHWWSFFNTWFIPLLILSMGIFLIVRGIILGWDSVS